MVAPQGYMQKANIWCTELASMMLHAIRYYATKKNMGMTMVNETKESKVFTTIFPVLDEVAMCKPGVMDTSALYLTKTISRMSKEDAPISHPAGSRTCARTEETSLSVLRTIVKTAKLALEAMYLTWQLLPYVKNEFFHADAEGRTDSMVFTKSAQVDVYPTQDHNYSQWPKSTTDPLVLVGANDFTLSV